MIKKILKINLKPLSLIKRFNNTNFNNFNQKDQIKQEPTKKESIGETISSAFVSASEGISYGYIETEKRLMSAIKSNNKAMFRIFFVFCGAVLITILFVIFHGKKIKTYVGTQSQDIVNDTLENETIKTKTNEIVKGASKAVLDDPETYEKVLNIAYGILNDETFRKQAIDLVYFVLSTKEVNDVTKKLVIDVINDPYVIKELQTMLGNIMASIEIKNKFDEAFVHAAQEALKSKEVDTLSKELVMNIVNDNKIRNDVQTFLNTIFLNLLTFGLYGNNNGNSNNNDSNNNGNNNDDDSNSNSNTTNKKI